MVARMCVFAVIDLLMHSGQDVAFVKRRLTMQINCPRPHHRLSLLATVGCGSRRVLRYASAAALLLASSASLAAVDVNHANAQELEQIKGIGAKTAQRIIVERTRGPFESLEHLSERLSGIGPKTVLKLRAGGLCAGTSQAPCAATQTVAINKQTGSKQNESKRTSSRNRAPSALLVTPEILQLP